MFWDSTLQDLPRSCIVEDQRTVSFENRLQKGFLCIKAAAGENFGVCMSVKERVRVKSSPSLFGLVLSVFLLFFVMFHRKEEEAHWQ